jgi:hypothetical protein
MFRWDRALQMNRRLVIRNVNANVALGFGAPSRLHLRFAITTFYPVTNPIGFQEGRDLSSCARFNRER